MFKVGQNCDKIAIEVALVIGKGGPLYTQGIGSSSGRKDGKNDPHFDLKEHLRFSEVTRAQKKVKIRK